MPRFVAIVVIALAACDLYQSQSNPPPDAGADANARLCNAYGECIDAMGERVPTEWGEPLDVQCKRWCGERESCTGEDWRVCFDECIEAPAILDTEPCDGR